MKAKCERHGAKCERPSPSHPAVRPPARPGPGSAGLVTGPAPAGPVTGRWQYPYLPGVGCPGDGNIPIFRGDAGRWQYPHILGGRGCPGDGNIPISRGRPGDGNIPISQGGGVRGMAMSPSPGGGLLVVVGGQRRGGGTRLRWGGWLG